MAAALKKKLNNAHYSNGGPRSERGPPLSNMRADCIVEEEEEDLKETVEVEMTSPSSSNDKKDSEDVPDDDSAKELTDNA